MLGDEESKGMPVISVRLPYWMVRAMDELVLKGVFISRSEIVRLGVRVILRKYRDMLNNSKIDRGEVVKAILEKKKLEEEGDVDEA